MRRRNEVTVTLGDSEDRQVAITAEYHACTPAYFSRSWGNWLPGDPEDIEVMDAKAVDEGANVAEVLSDVARVEEAVRLEACERDDDPYDTREEARGER
jgi:hypothetical protein